MRLIDYIRDHLFIIIFAFISYLMILMVLIALKTSLYGIVLITAIIIIIPVSILSFDYYRKKTFYKELLLNVSRLDEAYLVLEMLEKPQFYEGEMIYDALYDINKSMVENVKREKDKLKDYRDYIEMWIHEVKLPLASLILSISNQNYDNQKLRLQIKRLEDSIDRVLYYVRSDNAENDYLIKKVSLSKVIKDVIVKNMDDLLINHIKLQVMNTDFEIYTDSKWLEFIINQIISNSIKYRKGNDSYIKIDATKRNDVIELMIEDNGIGIENSEIRQVFDKTFTGSNGRGNHASTGMGLYIVKNLIQKLGHKIRIESEVMKYTRVIISFSINDHFLRY